MRERKKARRNLICAAICFSLLFAAGPFAAQPLLSVSAQEEENKALTYLDSVEKLIESNVTANKVTISLMLDKAESELEESHPAFLTLEQIRSSIDKGETNVKLLNVLVETARMQILDTGAGIQMAEQMTETDVPETETAAEAVPEPSAEAVPETEPSAEPVPETEPSAEPVPETEPAPAPSQEIVLPDFERKSSGLPVYDENAYIWKYMTDYVGLQVPGDWGNNEAGREVTSYSPINGSGAINVGAGTLQTTHYEEEKDLRDAYDDYVSSISKLSTTSRVSSADAFVNGIDGRRVTYTMSVGANVFSCESFCFQYGQNMYTIQLLQGNQSQYDYFDVFDNAVGSVRVGDPVILPENPAEETEPAQTEPTPTEPAATEPVPTEPVQTESAPAESEPAGTEPVPPQTEPAGTEPAQTEPMPTEPAQTEPMPTEPAQTEPMPTEPAETEPAPDMTGKDLGSFYYAIDGQEYHFPTSVRDLAAGALPIDPKAELRYDILPDAEKGGLFNELANTEYYFFQTNIYMEMVGVTNLTGRRTTVEEGIITTLIDLEGEDVELTLPGGIHIGSPEEDIARAFPEFAGMSLDGYAAFRGNELLYACNVRDDGCNGYVLICNDAPYYSALSLICENGKVREICFETLGKDRAAGVFE